MSSKHLSSFWHEYCALTSCAASERTTSQTARMALQDVCVLNGATCTQDGEPVLVSFFVVGIAPTYNETTLSFGWWLRLLLVILVSYSFKICGKNSTENVKKNLKKRLVRAVQSATVLGG